MPAAAVIPAPIAYIKVVAVEKLVVELVCRWFGDLMVFCILYGCGILLALIAIHPFGEHISALHWDLDMGISNQSL